MLKAQSKNNKGQSLIEILIGVTIATIIIGGAAATIALTLRSGTQNKNIQIATSLSQELIDELSSFADGNWHNIYGLSKLPSQHHLTEVGGVLGSAPNSETLPPVDGIAFTRYFTVENVSRDGSDDVEAVYNALNDDPSTQKVVVTTTWLELGEPAQVTLKKFLTRKKNLIIHQDSWDGGATAPADTDVDPAPVTGIVPNQFFDAGNVDISGGSIKVLGF